MTSPSHLQRLLQRVSSPFLPKIPQRRFAIVHEVLPGQEQVLRSVLELAERTPSLDFTLTFDDGFYSSYKAIRELRSRKALFFVCPEFIEHADSGNWKDFFSRNLRRTEELTDPDFAHAVQPASWEQLKELVRLGHRIGSHGFSHARLSSISSSKELEREIVGSADLLEDRLETKVDCFSNPFGDFKSIGTSALRVILRRYQYFFTGIRGNNHRSRHPKVFWRDTIHLYWPMDYIAFLLRGGFDWRYLPYRRALGTMAERLED